MGLEYTPCLVAEQKAFEFLSEPLHAHLLFRRLSRHGFAELVECAVTDAIKALHLWRHFHVLLHVIYQDAVLDELLHLFDVNPLTGLFC